MLIAKAVAVFVSVEELIPGIQKVVLIGCDNVFEIVQFMGGKALAAGESDRIQPELRLSVIMLDMDMWRFISVTGVKEEPIRSIAQDGRHTLW
jgi:hypothetical protein